MLTAIHAGTKNDCLRFMRDMNAKDMHALGNWFTDESSIWVPPGGPVFGFTRIMAMFRAIFRRYAAIDWTVNEIFEIEPNRFLIFHEANATFNSGTTYKNKVITDITFNADIKIIRLSDYFKNTAILS